MGKTGAFRPGVVRVAQASGDEDFILNREGAGERNRGFNLPIVRLQTNETTYVAYQTDFFHEKRRVELIAQAGSLSGGLLSLRPEGESLVKEDRSVKRICCAGQ